MNSASSFPTVALRLRVEALGAVTQAVLEGAAAFGVSGPLELASDLLTRGPAGSVKLLAVAAPGSSPGADARADQRGDGARSHPAGADRPLAADRRAATSAWWR